MLGRLIKHRRLLVPYLVKYSRLYFRLYLYKIRKLLNINIYAKLKKGFGRELGKHPSGVAVYTKQQMCTSFLSNNIDTVLTALRKDKTFFDSLSFTAEEVCNHRFLVLNEFWDLSGKKDKYIPWNYEYKSGFVFPSVHYSQVRKAIIPGVDIKNCWELSRMQYLFAPSLMYRITGNEKYALFVKSVISDWAQNNGCQEGPNWAPSMESGIRIANILLAFQLIKQSDSVDDDFCTSILATTHLHYKFIIQNEENIGNRTSNHYLGGLLGLLSIATTFPFLPYATKTLLYVRNSLEKEIQKQIFEDGGGFEGSSAYQQLIGEMFSLASIMVNNSGMTFSKEYYKRLSKAVEYSLALIKPDGTLSQIGDNDGGHIFRLVRTLSPDNTFFVSLGSAITSRGIPTASYCKETAIFCDSSPIFIEGTRKGVSFFPQSHQAVYRDDSLYLHLSALDATIHNSGHMHNDKLSFEISYMGRNFITDSGSGVYTSYPDVRNQLRSTRAHSTVRVANTEQNSFSPDLLFVMNHQMDIKTFSVTEDGKKIIFSASASHTVDPFYVHERTLSVDTEKMSVQITDIIREIIDVPIVWCAVLHPDVDVTTTENIAILDNNGVVIKITAFDEIRVREGFYSENYGKWEATKILEIEHQNNHALHEYSCKIDFGDK